MDQDVPKYISHVSFDVVRLTLIILRILCNSFEPQLLTKVILIYSVDFIKLTLFIDIN